MRLLRSRSIGVAVAGMLFASVAYAEDFSTSALKPTPVPAGGIIAGTYPAGNETTYYFAVDLKAGELASQISFMGRPNRDKKLEFDLLNANGRAVASHYIMGTLDANAEQARVLPVDAKGRYTIRLKLIGPEATSFRVELGGSALADRKPAPANGQGGYSVSYLTPSPLPKDGAISGKFPGGDRQYTYYYFTTDLKAGDLLSQISFAGRANAPKWLELNLLDKSGRSAASYYVMGELEAKRDATRKFAVDSSGRYVLRVGVKGAEGTQFRVDLGGNAFTTVQ
jgi:hypothetical protein